MKKLVVLILTLVTIIASLSTAVSAASVEDEIVSLTKLGFNFIEEVLGDYSGKIKDIFNIILDVAELCPTDTPKKEEPPKDDIPEDSPEIIVPPTTTSVEVRAGIFGYESTYVVYGEVVPCHWIHTNNFATAVEILSDVNSEEFLSTEDVEELFIEKFGHRAMVYESERQVKTFLLKDVYSGKEYLIPVKDEGLPIEVWEAFASKFEKDFTCEYDLLTERGIEIFFEEKLGYTPEIAVWHRGEDDVLLDIEFAHLGGMRYQIEAVYSEEFEECVLTEEALEAFLDKHPECSVVPNFTWEQLLNILDFYHNW